MKKDLIEIEYPAIFTTNETDEVIIKLPCFQKIFKGEDKVEAVTKAKKFLLEKIIEFKNKGNKVNEFMIHYPADDINELSTYLGNEDEIEYLSDTFFDNLNEFEEFTMFFIYKLEKSNKETKSWEELIMKQLKAIRKARTFTGDNGVPIISINKDNKSN